MRYRVDGAQPDEFKTYDLAKKQVRGYFTFDGLFKVIEEEQITAKNCDKQGFLLDMRG